MLPVCRRLTCLLLLALLPGALRAQTKLTSARYQQNFDYFWTIINENYCCFEKKQTDWTKMRTYYGAQLPSVTSKAQFTRLLENVLNELYDNHAPLSTNLPDSRRLLPSGTDVWAQYPVVVAVRAGCGGYGKPLASKTSLD